MLEAADSEKYRRRRARLVAALRGKGIADEAVLQALLQVPRHLFIPPEFEEQAYEDIALPFAAGQTISQPYTVAFQSSLLRVKPGMRVLEVGTGSGYQAAVLSLMGAEVQTVERIRALYEQALNAPYLQAYRSVHFHFGDGYEGFPPAAPYDAVLVTASVPSVPEKLLEQLAPGACLVLPLGNYGEKQQMLRLTRAGDGSIREENFGDFRFVPMLPGTA